MLRNRLYYGIKPFLPWPVRMGFRRVFARPRRFMSKSTWPVLPGSEQPPSNWPGWPEGKAFALVLTHDVERSQGKEKCCQLMELEMGLGFRSCFNFVPEADYVPPTDMLRDLTRNGFEVGVHDLHHDGKLYGTRHTFAENANRINHYLHQWGASGFRSGFMMHNLDWLHDLNIQYDASTFDTDPFEPQPDGAGTIFPFWVPRPNGTAHASRITDPASRITDHASRFTDHASRFTDHVSSLNHPNGYVELPCTLPQDSTLFLLFRERTADIWYQKLDWIAKHGGMALMITHPDYMTMNGAPKPREYPVRHYADFLQYVRARYSDSCWNPLPRDVAQFVVRSRHASVPEISSGRRAVAVSGKQKPKIWIDLDNTPHVPFFEPILEELQIRGYPLVVTARNAFQVYDLADKKGLKYTKVGRHHGRHRLIKAAGLIYRALQMAPIVLRERPQLSVSHGSRAQIFLSNCLRIPTLLIEDYEHCQFPPMMRPTVLLTPSVIPDDAVCRKRDHHRKYPGIKEDVYAWKLHPDPAILDELGLNPADLIVTVRPPATEAHYHNADSEALFEAFMDWACQTPSVKIVLLPRNKRQHDFIRGNWPQWFNNGKTVVPGKALDGMNLIWHSDLVVSGGGTMNREAAALGVPVYSIFRGLIGAVDRQLCAEGRLFLIESLEDVEREIRLVKRTRRLLSKTASKRTLQSVVDTIQEIAENGHH